MPLRDRRFMFNPTFQHPMPFFIHRLLEHEDKHKGSATYMTAELIKPGFAQCGVSQSGQSLIGLCGSSQCRSRLSLHHYAIEQ
ncbi:hypothetical protein TNIN_229501 [Trichonephila inaurata madagascariensis]|uniref:Uncharacterized protein n=1 Tax=Trichonephila inaurata madagascariensis TaxID=2747483 RepID=A0A8X6YBH6_9ARAC|nr:hypothetical protein TNIN_229501 [Trichonephila inaurata madagascariensis]